MLAFFLGGLSWISSLSAGSAYDATTWQCLVTGMLIDGIFMYWFYTSKVNYIKTRWVCSLLTLGIIATGTFSILSYSFEYYLIDEDFFLLSFFVSAYETFGFVVSLLIMVVAITPQKIIGALDGNYWPKFANGIRYSCDMDSTNNTKSNLQ